MAKFGFGLNVNETAQENGYDQYQTTLKESLGAVAADNWEFNPAMATFKRWKMYEAKSISEEGERSPRNQPILRVNRDKLNKQYSNWIDHNLMKIQYLTCCLTQIEGFLKNHY